jgi:hypothetical protein
MDEKWKELEGKPFSKLFIIEVATILFVFALSFYLFGFSYRSADTGKSVVSFQGIIKISK